MGGIVSHNSPLANSLEGKKTIEERACSLARYIIDSKDTVRGAAKKFRDFKINSTHRSNIKER